MTEKIADLLKKYKMIFYSVKKKDKLFSLREKGIFHYLINVLRLKKNDKILLNDQQFLYFTKILEVDKRKRIIFLNCIERIPLPQKKYNLNIYMGITKGYKLDSVISKLAQFGVDNIYLFYSDFSDVKSDLSEKKLERWQRIAENSAEQSLNPFIPKVHHPLKLENFLQKIEGLNVVFYEKAEDYKINETLFNDEIINIFIGPEGGFSNKEIKIFKEKNSVISLLCRNRLRSETASIAAVSIVKYFIDKIVAS